MLDGHRPRHEQLDSIGMGHDVLSDQGAAIETLRLGASSHGGGTKGGKIVPSAVTGFHPV